MYKIKTITLCYYSIEVFFLYLQFYIQYIISYLYYTLEDGMYIASSTESSTLVLNEWMNENYDENVHP